MKPLRLLFADDSWQYDGNTPENHPLGGAHSSFVYLTRALAEQGHDVHVYNNCKSPGLLHGVHYHVIADIVEANKFIYSDAFISLRNPRVFRAWINAGVRILWSGDAVDQPVLGDYLKSNDDVRQNIDYIFCKSRWQAWTFMNHFNWPENKIFVTRNAVWPEHFPKEFIEPSDNRLVYTSTPFRGLELLLKLFPKIKSQVPDSELHLFSSWQVYQHSKKADEKKYGYIYKLAEQPGVIMHGSVGQKNLAVELAKCRLLAYPNTFHETSCLSVMEALAAGCAVVTSWLAALPETVGPGGALISGIPGSDDYNAAFVENCVRFLKDRAFWRKTATAGREWILNHFTWDKVAKEWTGQINKLTQKNEMKIAEVKGWPPQKNQSGNGKSELVNCRISKNQKIVKPLRLVFADNSWPFDGSTPEHSPLGGAQSSMIYLTRKLAAIGHDVHVYNNCNSPGEFHGVYYHKLDELDKANKFLFADGFIALRNPTFFRNWLNAAVRILWTGDAIDQPNLQILKSQQDVRNNIDYIFCKSQWQAWTFINHFNWPTEKIMVTRNAVWPDYFPEKFPEPQGSRLVYSSTPFRGLELLLRYFPSIHKAVPDAELHVFSSMQVYQQSKAEDQEKFGHLYKLAEQPGVIMHGSVGQRELTAEHAKCRVFAYPNIFPETCCTAAMEAMAAGCAVVTSELACMPETVGPGGILISGIPGTKEYNDAFVENCIRLFTDQTLWRKTAMAGREWILNYFTWDNVALEWSERINKLIQRSQKKLNKLAGWHPENSSREENAPELVSHDKNKIRETWEPLRLIFADNSLAYDGNTPDYFPLSAPHSALVYLTRELAALGHDVHVYNNCGSSGLFQGVHYHKFIELIAVNNIEYAEAFISLQNPTYFSSWLNAGVRILWTQDTFDQPHLHTLKFQEDVRQNIDCIFCVSKWQAWTYLNHFHWSTEKVFISHNGVWPEYFPKKFAEPEGRRLVYTNTPLKGLELLLRLFPEIRRLVPDAELHVFSNMPDYQQSKEHAQIEYIRLHKHAEQTGVILHSPIRQKDLAAELSKCRVFAYPNAIPEITGSSVMEALAAGCSVVTSQLGTLRETVENGRILIPGIPDTEEYNQAFVSNCVRLLKDNSFWRKRAKAGKDNILNHFTWNKVALEWTKQINKLVHERQAEVANLEGWQPLSSWRNKD